MKRTGCPSGHIITARGECRPKNWRYLADGESYHGILNYKDSHWGKGQTGISLCRDGTFDVAENIPLYTRGKNYIMSDKQEVYFPTHRSLKTIGCFEAIYSFAWPNDHPGGTIWLYPDAERVMPKLIDALCAFKGKYGSSEETKVKSNTSRKLLWILGENCP